MRLTGRLVKALALMVALIMIVPGAALGAPTLTSVEIANLVLETEGMTLDFSPVSLTLQSGVDSVGKLFVEKVILRPSENSVHGLLLNLGKKGLSLGGTHVTKGLTMSYLDMASILEGIAPDILAMMPANMELPDAAFEAGALLDTTFSQTVMEEKSELIKADIEALVDKHLAPHSTAPVKETRDFFGELTEMEFVAYDVPSDVVKAFAIEYYTYAYGEEGLFAKLYGSAGKSMMNLLNNVVKMSEGKSLIDTMTIALENLDFTEFKLNVWTIDEANAVSDGAVSVVDLSQENAEPVSIVYDVAVKKIDEYNAQVVFDMDVNADSVIIGARLNGDMVGDASQCSGKFDLLAGNLLEMGGEINADEDGLSLTFT